MAAVDVPAKGRDVRWLPETCAKGTGFGERVSRDAPSEGGKPRGKSPEKPSEGD